MRKRDVPRLADLLHDLISKHGQTTLANTIGIDSSALSRFKNGEGAMSLKNLEGLFSEADVIFIERKKYKQLKQTIIILSECLSEEMGA